MKKLIAILALFLLPGLAWADVESMPTKENISQDNNAADKKTEAEDKPKHKDPDYHIWFLEDMKYCAEHMKLVLHKVSKDKYGKFEDEEHIKNLLGETYNINDVYVIYDGELMPTTEINVDCHLDFIKENLYELEYYHAKRRTYYVPKIKGKILPTSPHE